jgi:cation diffusion facilitator CzcD-associated flavoprotein CzcO
VQQLEQSPGNAVAVEHFDVIVVGAGLSGIAAGYHLKTTCPQKSFVILEGRDVIGGTWDLFRYPGVRSDSDMHTLGYGFRPWTSRISIAAGPDILSYIRSTAQAEGIDRKIRFGQYVTDASWSSEDALWTISVNVGPDRAPMRYTCGFLFMCSGYYDYKSGYLPEWPEMSTYRGQLVHPQFWPEDLDYKGKRVVIIGSGATAMTLAPAMATDAAHVTMLQRSPTYVVARPAHDSIAERIQKRLRGRLGGTLVRWKNVLYGLFTYNLARKRPAMVKKTILRLASEHLGPDYDMTHFTPSYNPWDQRICLVPDADLFACIRSGAMDVVTDHIERFTETGLLLKSGKTLDADIIVTATGLKMQLVGGMRIVVDGAPVDLGKSMNYKGMMFSDVPNLALTFGYTNASWTLKCELIANHICRLLNYMDAKDYAICTPRRDLSLTEEPALNFTSGYVLRAEGILPKQGSRKPWKLYQNYFLDMASLRFGKVANPSMEFKKRKKQRVVA